MKNAFPGYFPLTKRKITKIWKNCIFTFDASVLLNLYRYSDETRNELFGILNSLKNRIWLSHQAALEYFNNRLNVISKHEKTYDDMTSKVDSIEKSFKDIKQHPFISDNLLEELCKTFEKVKNELKNNKKSHREKVHKDDIQNKIAALFKNKVGLEYKGEELEKIYKPGEKRYAQKIPPGYMDEKKGDVRKFGDLILWYQIINKSKNEKKDIILIIDERKEDWWLKYNYDSTIVSPRPELIKEFKNQTGKNFYMYRMDNFIEYASSFLKRYVKPETISEIREIRRREELTDMDLRKIIDRDKERYIWYADRDRELIELENNLKHLIYKEKLIKSRISNIKSKIQNEEASDSEILDINYLETMLSDMVDDQKLIQYKIDRILRDKSNYMD